MRYVCTNCNYLYDESLGDKEEWILAWTRFDTLWDMFECPVCHETGDYFHELKEQVNYFPVNISESEQRLLSPIEKEHFPHIENADEWYIKIRIDHPMEQEHFISSLSLVDDTWDIIEEEFLTPESVAEVEFNITDLDEYEVRVKCNLHGSWGRKFNY